MNIRRSPARGVALITAILVVSIAVIAATAVLDGGAFAIQRASTIQDSERAWWYALGAEEWSRIVLAKDEDKQVDGLEEPWMMPVNLPIDGGTMSGQLVDLQGRFNLNNLGADPQGPAFKVYAAQFARILELSSEMDTNAAQEFIERIHDWIDPDQEPSGFGGAEDTEYLGMDPPHRTANRLLESPSELLAIRVSRGDATGDATRKAFAGLRKCDCVTTLPAIGTRINVNTAPEMLLLSMQQSASSELAAFLEARRKTPVRSLSELTSANVFDANRDFGQQSVESFLDVQTEFVGLRVRATVGNGHVALYSLIYRGTGGGGEPIVLSRNTDTD
ncbi:MAG TPA: type II secretion system minor pseudopilin GspK [Nevskiaceae bacterium]|nr:type II secretion system minor pseudopilin GspK [Nevskiaceae bacterium]